MVEGRQEEQQDSILERAGRLPGTEPQRGVGDGECVCIKEPM